MTAARQYDTDAYLPEDIMREIALRISVLDLPSFLLTSKWFAQHVTTWWQHQIKQLFPQHSTTSSSLTNRHLFFSYYQQIPDRYRLTDLAKRRRHAQVAKGDIETLIKEHHEDCNIGNVKALIPIEFGFLFEVDEKKFGDQLTLFQRAHTLSADKKKLTLDFFYTEFFEPRLLDSTTISANKLISRKTLLRNSLELSTSTLNDFKNLIRHLQIIDHLGYSTNSRTALILYKSGANIYKCAPNSTLRAIDRIAWQWSTAYLGGHRRPDNDTIDLAHYLKKHHPEITTLLVNKSNLREQFADMLFDKLFPPKPIAKLVITTSSNRR